MATLADIWEQPGRIITNVAKRPSGIYVSLGHKTYAAAVDAAREWQPLLAADEIADDWVVAEAP